MTSFAWTIEDSSGEKHPGDESFATREEAEEWLAESWRSLLEGGSEQVSLLRDGEPVYRMSLRAEGLA